MTMRLLLAAIVCALAGCSSPQRPVVQEKAKTAQPVRILQFYATNAVARGDAVTICYGVENARAVRIDPPVEELKPAYNRCLQASPRADTTYRLTAEGFDGKIATQAVSVKVLPAAVQAAPHVAPTLIQTFAASAEVVAPGGPLVLCYSAPDATTVTIDPPIRELEPVDRLCFSTRVARTTTYTLTTTGAGGKKETERITVTVK
jgi:hypothetical protein